MLMRQLTPGTTVALTEPNKTEPTLARIQYAYFDHFVAYERVGEPEETKYGSMLYRAFLKNGKVAA